MIAAIGAASAFVESALGQAYKVKNPDGEFSGGPAYYIEKGLKCKPYAILFAIVAFLGPGFLMPGVQINSLVTVFEEAFSVNKILVGAICCVILGIVVYGSIKRIAQIAELLAPAMCAVYILAAVIILGLNITKLPGILKMIIQSAFGVQYWEVLLVLQFHGESNVVFIPMKREWDVVRSFLQRQNVHILQNRD